MPHYPGDDGSLILHFGYGDIAIASGKGTDREKTDELVFIGGEPGEIGRYGSHEGQSSADLDVPVRMIFESVEALDVVLEQLTSLRTTMIEEGSASALSLAC